MRASPPIDIELSRSSAWLACILTVAFAVIVVVSVWLTLALRELALSPMVAMGLAALTLGLVAFALRLTPRTGGRLRWTGRTWELDDDVPDGRPRRTGDVAVAIDLGSWLLLRFSSPADQGEPARWLPVERRRHEAEWHALRCALHSCRAASDSS